MRRHFSVSRVEKSPRSKRRRGVILILSAAVVVVVCGFAALVVDYGLLTIAQVQLQNAVDAAAHAGVADLYDATGQYTETVATTTAEEFAGYNSVLGEPVANVSVAPGRVEPDYKFDVPFTATDDNANSVEVTASMSISLFFAPVIGHESATVSARAVATITQLQRADLVPLALRAPGFGQVDPAIAEVNPGKDGPSMPANGKFFKVGEPISLFIFGKGKKPPVHLALDSGPTNPSDAFKVLRGDEPPLPVSLGDDFLVFNEGTGSNSFGVQFADRLGQKNNPTDEDDPLRTVVVPVVQILEDSRNDKDQIDGFVRVVDFVAVHLDEIVPATVVDPKNPSRTIDIEILMGTVIRMNVNPDLVRTGPAGPDDPTTGEFTAYSIRLTQ